jgi:hypothetical protein
VHFHAKCSFANANSVNAYSRSNCKSKLHIGLVVELRVARPRGRFQNFSRRFRGSLATLLWSAKQLARDENLDKTETLLQPMSLRDPMRSGNLVMEPFSSLFVAWAAACT